MSVKPERNEVMSRLRELTDWIQQVRDVGMTATGVTQEDVSLLALEGVYLLGELMLGDESTTVSDEPTSV